MHLKAYVDGSFIDGKTGYGAVIIKDGKIIEKLFGPVKGDAAHRQVSGEIEAVIQVLGWCQKNNEDKIEIYYDYEGVSAWGRGVWKTNLELTKNYKTFVQTCGIEISWQKIKAHSGDKFNDMADELAKTGAGQGEAATSSREELCADDFEEYLQDRAIQTKLVEMQGFERIEFYCGKTKTGIVDVYYKKSGLKADFRGFKDEALRCDAEKLWNDFLKSR